MTGEAPDRAPTLRTAVVANLVGRGWPILLGFAAVPLYLRHLGVETYALVLAFATVQALSSVLDMGLGATLTRELARARSASDARNLVRSFEVPYWLGAFALCLAVLAVAGPVAERWLRPESVTPETIRSAAVLMGLGVAAQLPFTLYSGGLLGLQRQVLLNGVIVAAATLRVAGTLYVLEYVSPTIEAFFVCQVVVSALQSAAGFAALWSALPRSDVRARFDGVLLKANLRFAFGVAAITVVSLALTQVDKVVLSGMLPLREFAYYGFAATVAGALGAIAQPVFTAVFPRFSKLAASADRAAEAMEYHRAAQLLSVLVFPVAVALAWLSHDVLLAWTGKPDVAANAHVVTSLLLLGGALNSAMHVPYALMLAHGWTKLPLVTNVVAVLLLTPLLVWSTRHHGAVGAAAVWLVLNAGYLVVSIPVLHKRVLPGEKARWYVHDLALPLVGALAGAAVGDALLPATDGRWPTLARVALVVAIACAGATSLAPEVRRPLLARLRRLRPSG